MTEFFSSHKSFVPNDSTINAIEVRFESNFHYFLAKFRKRFAYEKTHYFNDC